MSCRAGPRPLHAVPARPGRKPRRRLARRLRAAYGGGHHCHPIVQRAVQASPLCRGRTSPRGRARAASSGTPAQACRRQAARSGTLSAALGGRVAPGTIVGAADSALPVRAMGRRALPGRVSGLTRPRGPSPPSVFAAAGTA